jgi:putative membrane protein
MLDEVPPELPVLSQNELALERTVMAQERTLMAWLRTSMAMISFGFSLRQFFELMTTRAGHEHPRFGAPHFGLAMMVVGLTMLALASLQHVQAMRRLRKSGVHAPFSLSLLFAVVSLALGTFTLIATLLAF